jgi:D-alanyl-D-alanine dipeptidase
MVKPNSIALLVVGLFFVAGLMTMHRKALRRSEAQLAGEAARKAQSPLAGAGQALVVTTANWEVVNGTLQRYERQSANGPWQAVGDAIPIVVGRNGLAWGRGLHGDAEAFAQANHPRKREGDGKSPAGVFRLSSAFGYAAQDQRIKLPYRQARAATQCVDDAQSAFYNQLVERDRIPQPDWQSHEDMRRPDEQYRWGVFVEHNSSAQRQASGGSCIFLHIWAGQSKGTAGCTAMEAGLMEQVLFWLDAAQQPVLVQLPMPQYARLKAQWQLP